jgi:hypothetical protein
MRVATAEAEAQHSIRLMVRTSKAPFAEAMCLKEDKGDDDHDDDDDKGDDEGNDDEDGIEDVECDDSDD